MKYINKKTARLNSALFGDDRRWTLVYRLLLGLLCFIFATPGGYAQQKPKIGRGDVQAVKVEFLRITKISGGTVTARSETGHTIEFNRPSSDLNVGQKVWADDKNVTGVNFPIHGSIKSQVGDGDFMETSVTLSNTGRIDATTITKTSACQDGFTGGVMVFLFDLQGNVLHSTPLKRYGVNGTCIPTAQSKRTDGWEDTTVPVDAVNKTRFVKIVHRKAPTPRTDDFLKNAKDVADIVKTFTDGYKNVAGGN